MFITDGATADCSQAANLISGIEADCLIADKAYDTNDIIDLAVQGDMEVVIPAKKNRLHQREYDKYLYKLRHLVENAFLRLKQWRGGATRYAKNSASFLAALHISCIAIWMKIY